MQPPMFDEDLILKGFEDLEADQLEPRTSPPGTVEIAIGDLARVLAQNVEAEARINDLLNANNALVEENRALRRQALPYVSAGPFAEPRP